MTHESRRELIQLELEADQTIRELADFHFNADSNMEAIALAGLAVARSIRALNYSLRVELNELKNELAT